MEIWEDLVRQTGVAPGLYEVDVTLTGYTDPICDSPYRLVEGISSIHAAIGSAAAGIWKIRSGESQSVVVDRTQGIPSMHRIPYVYQNGTHIIATGRTCRSASITSAFDPQLTCGAASLAIGESFVAPLSD